MKNYEIHGYNPMSICDSHIHCHVKISLDETVEIYNNVKQHYNLEKFAICCLPMPIYSFSDNYKALYCKDMIDGVYVNAGILHTFDKPETSDYYLSEIKKYHAMGCDGIKMIEGKPDDRKMLGKRLDDKDFDKFYEYAEENQIPILMHWGDPSEFWDINRIPQWALERGWLYDDSYPPYKEFRGEVEGFLKKFPKLKITFAHFFFTSDEYEYAEKVMETWENVCFDLTPGSEMYKNFNASPEKWRNFFLKYSGRILYGTDIYNWESEGKTVEQRYSHAVNLERSFLERKEGFVDPWIQVSMDHPFGFDDDVLSKIYNKNFKRIWGENPRPLDKELIASECKKFLESVKLCEVEEKNMKQLIEHFSK